SKTRIATFSFKKSKNIWSAKIPKEYEGFYYWIKIQHKGSDEYEYTIDPYAKAFAPFDWQGKTDEVPLAILVDWKKASDSVKKRPLETEFNNSVDPVIYELNIRDFTSLLDQKKFKSRLGTFDAAIENKIFDYVRELGFTHIQLLPIHAPYTTNADNLNILNKGEGTGWTTNYNWGYDPLNYFALNNWYTNNPKDAAAGIIEFKKFVKKAHKKGIGIIMDVVFNHTMTNSLFEKLTKDYYYRTGSEVYPVDQPALNTEAKMVRRMIIDSLSYYVDEFDVDGFRFDLSTFIDKETLKEISRVLKRKNKNIILHGEAWPFSDLDYTNSLTKGVTDNDYNFFYFNDTIRNAIKGADSIEANEKGLIQGNTEKMASFVSSIVGNIKRYSFSGLEIYSNTEYDLFSRENNIALQYAACHDGFSLWDKILTTSDKDFEENIALNNQALMMQFTSQGRQLVLAGTELLQTKPLDLSGCHDNRYLPVLNKNSLVIDDGNHFVVDNSYKTTDYTNGIKWDHLKNPRVKEVHDFTRKLINFRNKTKFFRLTNFKTYNRNIYILENEKDFVSYKIKYNKEEVFVIHNFGKERKTLYPTKKYKIAVSSRPYISSLVKERIIPAHTSVILTLRDKEETEKAE
ncbi:alpha-amylase family glycosyl hydrolase, partial [Mycoplasma procyoni]|uniref:alpha-amylase family glycosyl hydrolase n=1 Tax=Mycoplasma procyoni TaxID=568784 RepID=UPI00197B228F